MSTASSVAGILTSHYHKSSNCAEYTTHCPPSGPGTAHCCNYRSCCDCSHRLLSCQKVRVVSPSPASLGPSLHLPPLPLPSLPSLILLRFREGGYRFDDEDTMTSNQQEMVESRVIFNTGAPQWGEGHVLAGTQCHMIWIQSHDDLCNVTSRHIRMSHDIT